MAVKKGYKQSEVGFIPDDWYSEALGNHATFKTGPFGSLLHRSDYVDSGIPIVNPMQIIDGTLVPTQSMTISEAAAKRLSMFRLSSGDVVIGRRGDMGRCAYVRPENDGWLCGTGSMIICCRSSLNSRYLQRVLSSPQIIAAIESASVGTTMINLNNSTLRKLQIPLPPTLAEQEAIAGALSDADAWIESLEQLIAKKRQIKQGAMQELLTGKRRLPGFSGEWETKRLGYMVSTPITDGPHLTPRFLTDGVPFLSVNNLVDNKIDFQEVRYISENDDQLFSRKCKPCRGDILLGKAASVGKVGLVTTDLDFNIWSPIAMIRINNQYSSLFVYYQLQSKGLARQIALLTNSSSQGNIGMSDIEKLAIQHPCIAEQSAIATVLSDMDTEIESLESKLAKARDVKQGMMQELLTGRIRLV